MFKKFGQAGLLGLTRDPRYSGAGLDYSYTVAMYEEMGGKLQCGGIATAISVRSIETFNLNSKCLSKGISVSV